MTLWDLVAQFGYDESVLADAGVNSLCWKEDLRTKPLDIRAYHGPEGVVARINVGCPNFGQHEDVLIFTVQVYTGAVTECVRIHHWSFILPRN